MEFSESASEEEDREAKYYSNLYYVDNITVEDAENDSEINLANIDKKTKNAISKRYWSNGPKNLFSPQSKKQNVKIVSNNNKNGKFSKVLSNSMNKKKQLSRSLNDFNDYNKNENVLNISYPLTIPKDNVDKNVEKFSALKKTHTNPVCTDPNKNLETEPNNEQVAESQIKNAPSHSNNKNIKNSVLQPSPAISKVKKVFKNKSKNQSQIVTDVHSKNDSHVNIDSKKHIQNKGNNIPSDEVIDLESTDDESVVEVERPFEPAICIDSSDEEILSKKFVNIQNSSTPLNRNAKKQKLESNQKKCVSPVPSVVSSTSDDFIQSDCTNLKISTKGDCENLIFNFQLHGADLAEEISTFNDDKSKKKTYAANERDVSLKNKIDSSYISSNVVDNSLNDNQMFATPKSKGKKKQRCELNKTYTISNESFIPFTDIYESESSDFPDSVVDVPITSFALKKIKETSQTKSKNQSSLECFEDNTENSLIMANVVGIDNSKMDKNSSRSNDCVINVDDELDHNSSYIMINSAASDEKTTVEKCVKDMNTFYNESWGGENFDHINIKNRIPNSKELWAIDLADKQCDRYKKNSKQLCLVCNKFGHREEKCRHRIKKCLMCGIDGHHQSKCPNRLCLTCGEKNVSFSNKCCNCIRWKNIKCSICNMYGHPNRSCPDLWRRYHLTLKNEIPLITDSSKKVPSNLFCSGCAKKGHIVNNCKSYQPRYNFSLPYVYEYKPVYVPDGVRAPTESVERQDKSNTTSKSTKVSESHSDNIPLQNKRKAELVKNNQKSPKKMKMERVEENNKTENIEMLAKNNNGTSQILLTQTQQQKLSSKDGSEVLKTLSTKYNLNVKQQFTVLGHVLYVSGNQNYQNAFKTEFNKWLSSPVNVCLFISENKHKALQDIFYNLNLLDKVLGNPIKLHNLLVNLQKKLKNLVAKNDISEAVQFTSQKIDETCKSLNMILIGQAGLCKGKEILSKIREEILKIQNQTSDEITSESRNELSKLFFPIFSSAPREDYYDLVRQLKQESHLLPKRLQRNMKGKIVKKEIRSENVVNRPSTSGASDKKKFKSLHSVIKKVKNISRSKRDSPYFLQQTFKTLRSFNSKTKFSEIIHGHSSKNNFSQQ